MLFDITSCHCQGKGKGTLASEEKDIPSGGRKHGGWNSPVMFYFLLNNFFVLCILLFILLLLIFLPHCCFQ